MCIRDRNGIAYTEVDVALDADSETVEVADVTVIVPGDTDVSLSLIHI